MTPREIDDVCLVDDAATMELLTEPTRRELMERLLEPRSVTELARSMEVPRTRLYHHIRMLADAGMIVVHATREVGAITEKRYRAVAKAFRPSEKYLGQASAKGQAIAILDAAFGATKADVVRAVGEGKATMEGAGAPRRMSIGRRLARLTPDRLDELITELDELIERFDSEGDVPGAIPVGILHVVHPSSRSV